VSSVYKLREARGLGMNRRKFLAGTAGVTALPMIASGAFNYFPNGITNDGPHHHWEPDFQGVIFTETYLGEEISFERWLNWDHDYWQYQVRARFSVNEKPNVTYALGWRQFRESFEDNKDIGWHLNLLRSAMKHTIGRVKGDPLEINFSSNAGTCAPIKPEGCHTMLIR